MVGYLQNINKANKANKATQNKTKSCRRKKFQGNRNTLMPMQPIAAETTTLKQHRHTDNSSKHKRKRKRKAETHSQFQAVANKN